MLIDGDNGMKLASGGAEGGIRIQRQAFIMAHTTHDDELIQALRQRLHGVSDLLQLMADLKVRRKQPVAPDGAVDSEPDDEESDHAEKLSPTKMVHDLRVSCRRAETALDAGRSHLTNKAAAWFRDHLQKVRDSCNALRDDEVLRKWLREQTACEAQQRLIKCISKDMKAGCRVVAARARKLILQNHFRRHIHDLEPRAGIVKSVESGSSLTDHWQLELGRWLFHVLDDLIQAMPDDPNDFGALHQLRVAGKHLRYGMELVQELDPTASLAGSIGLLHDMQDKLGELHDAVVRLPRLKSEFADAASDAAEIITAALEDLERCIVGWHEWWEFKILDQVVSECAREATRLLMAERS